MVHTAVDSIELNRVGNELCAMQSVQALVFGNSAEMTKTTYTAIKSKSFPMGNPLKLWAAAASVQLSTMSPIKHMHAIAASIHCAMSFMAVCLGLPLISGSQTQNVTMTAAKMLMEHTVSKV